MTSLLPITRYTFTVQAIVPLRLPDFAGSMLRGAFGAALRRVACMTRQKDCQGCPLVSTCPYPLIFETPVLQQHSLQKFNNLPNPYVIEPPMGGARTVQAGEQFSFGMVLIGKALPQLPLIILAWERALEHGLSKSRSRCQLISVHCDMEEEPVYMASTKQIRAHLPQSIEPLPIVDSVTLDFITPLRLQRDGNRVGLRELDARTLLITLARRHQLLCDTHLSEPPQTDFIALDRAAQAIKLTSAMHWHDWTRYSSRQDQTMTLGGLVGQIELQGNLSHFASILNYGQRLHIGKNTSFGLGHYCIL